jgi:Na+/glutamate symporter
MYKHKLKTIIRILLEQEFYRYLLHVCKQHASFSYFTIKAIVTFKLSALFNIASSKCCVCVCVYIYIYIYIYIYTVVPPDNGHEDVRNM